MSGVTLGRGRCTPEAEWIATRPSVLLLQHGDPPECGCPRQGENLICNPRSDRRLPSAPVTFSQTFDTGAASWRSGKSIRRELHSRKMFNTGRTESTAMGPRGASSRSTLSTALSLRFDGRAVNYQFPEFSRMWPKGRLIRSKLELGPRRPRYDFVFCPKMVAVRSEDLHGFYSSNPTVPFGFLRLLLQPTRLSRSWTHVVNP